MTCHAPSSHAHSLASALLIAGALAVPLAGCAQPYTPVNEGRSGYRMDPTRDSDAELGTLAPRSADLVNATDQMAADIASRIDIIDRENPPVVFVGEMANKTTRLRGQDYDIFLTRLRGLLNEASTRHGIRFVRERGFVESARASEYGNETGSAPQDYRSMADYVLTGEIMDLPSGDTNFILISAQLVQLRDAASGPDVGAGFMIWEKQYEVKFQ